MAGYESSALGEDPRFQNSEGVLFAAFIPAKLEECWDAFGILSFPQRGWIERDTERDDSFFALFGVEGDALMVFDQASSGLRADGSSKQKDRVVGIFDAKMDRVALTFRIEQFVDTHTVSNVHEQTVLILAHITQWSRKCKQLLFCSYYSLLPIYAIMRAI